jgi:tetratricopeptide (TPR) repeat protein
MQRKRKAPPAAALSTDHLRAAGGALAREGRFDLACDFLAAALDRVGLDPALLTSYSSSLRMAGRYKQALAAIRSAIAIEPAAYRELALACTLKDSGDGATAESVLRETVEQNPDYPHAAGVLGVWLVERWRLGDGTRDELLEEAGTFIKHATADPRCTLDFHEAALDLIQLGGRIPEWLAASRELSTRYPDFHKFAVHYAFALLKAGDFARGLPAFMQMMHTRPDLRQSCNIWELPMWWPNQAPGRVLVWNPEGAGDLFQFARYFRLAAAHGAELELHASAPFERLMRRCAGLAKLTVPTVTRVDPSGAQNWDIGPDVDRWASIWGLAAAFTTRESEIPTEPYLSAEPEAIERWCCRLAGLPGLKVGIAWRGNLKQADDSRRSFNFEQYRPLFRVPGTSLVSLQKGNIMPKTSPVLDLGRDYEADDWAETAALIANLDIVIAPCTGIAHLAGAMGKPVWLALSEPGCWRWLTEREDSPWYPSMRIFRQTRRGDWSTVFEPMAAALAAASSG